MGDRDPRQPRVKEADWFPLEHEHYRIKQLYDCNKQADIAGRNAAQRRYQLSTGRFKVPPAPLSPFSTRVSAGMKPPLGRDLSVNMTQR